MIFNWLITKYCQLNCCQFGMGNEKKFIDIESMKTVLQKYKNDFHIFYGGEPTTHPNFYELISFCKNHRISHTVITNGLNVCLDFEFYSITCSIDPTHLDPSRILKTNAGLETLLKCKSSEKVAEITIKHGDDIEYLFYLMDILEENNILMLINFADISKNNEYDFSSYKDPTIIPRKFEMKPIIHKILSEYYSILFPEYLEILLDSLPSNYSCNIPNDLNNWTINPDGTFRLCLRINGHISKQFNIFDDIDLSDLQKQLQIKKEIYCQKCNWTCAMFSDTRL